MPQLVLDNLEFRSPIADFQRRDGSMLGLPVNQVWQRRFKNLWDYVSTLNRIQDVSASRNVTTSDLRSMMVCTGTITLTLPTPSRAGDQYYFFNNDVGVITIAGTINNNAAGYQLTNRYQYVQVASLDGTNWIVTLNN